MVRMIVAIGAVIICLGRVGAQTSLTGTSKEPPHATTRQILSQQVQVSTGTLLRISLIEVRYPPGGASPAHSHPCPVVGYVESGAVRMKVKGSPERVYKTGESFYEAANGTHEISANASQTEPAAFIAYFACDHDQPLSAETNPGSSR